MYLLTLGIIANPYYSAKTYLPVSHSTNGMALDESSCTLTDQSVLFQQCTHSLRRDWNASYGPNYKFQCYCYAVPLITYYSRQSSGSTLGTITVKHMVPITANTVVATKAR